MISRLSPGARTALLLAGVLAVAAAARMPFWLASTHAYGHGDAIIWQVWSRSIYEHGFINVLRTADSNNIGYHYVLWPTSIVYGWISPEYELWTRPIRVLIKIPPFVCDLVLTAIIFYAARGLSRATSGGTRDLHAAAAAGAFALAPATIYDSMWWSQIDSVTTTCTLGALLLLARGNAGWGFALWAVGFLFKPQPIVVLPAMVAFTYWRFGANATFRGLGAGAAVVAAALAPFVLHGDARLIGETYDRMFEQGPIDLVQGAWNGWSILDARGDPVPSDTVFTLVGLDITYAALSLALCAGAAFIALAYLRRHTDLEGLLVTSAALVFAFYMLPTSTHERYLYAAFAMMAPLLVRSTWLVALYGALAVSFFLNLLAINPPNANEFWEWHGTDFAVAVAVWHLVAYVLCTLWLLRYGALAPVFARATMPAVAPAPPMAG